VDRRHFRPLTSEDSLGRSTNAPPLDPPADGPSAHRRVCRSFPRGGLGPRLRGHSPHPRRPHRAPSGGGPPDHSDERRNSRPRGGITARIAAGPGLVVEGLERAHLAATGGDDVTGLDGDAGSRPHRPGQSGRRPAGSAFPVLGGQVLRLSLPAAVPGREPDGAPLSPPVRPTGRGCQLAVPSRLRLPAALRHH